MNFKLRRDFLITIVTSLFLIISGCTLFRDTNGEIIVENIGDGKETVEYYVSSDNERTDIKSVELQPGERYSDLVEVTRGDEVVISTDSMKLEFELNGIICNDPVLHTEVENGAIAGGWDC